LKLTRPIFVLSGLLPGYTSKLEITKCDLKFGWNMSKRVVALARRVESRILVLRGLKVIVDADLAELYGVEVRHLNQQVKRNVKRFPSAFCFQITRREHKILRSQNVISSEGHGGRRYPPFVFTEHGAIMAATVLSSERAIEMSVFVVLAFVRMRQVLTENRQIAAKLAELERRLEGHDADIQDVMSAIRALTTPSAPTRKRIGFELPATSSRLRLKAS
jgi:phage regulator Rha-like protein